MTTYTYSRYRPWVNHWPKYGYNDAIETLAEMNDFYCLDSEGTGLKATDQMTELAIVDYATNEVLINTLLLPRDFDEEKFNSSKASEVSGLIAEHLKDSPTFADIHPTLVELLPEKPIAIYNDWYDGRSLYRSASAWDLKLPAFTTIDIMRLFGAFVELPDFISLDNACLMMGIERTTRHEALADVLDMIKLIQVMKGERP